MRADMTHGSAGGSARDERTLALIFDKDDEVIADLTGYIRAHSMTANHFTAIGAFRELTLGLLNRGEKGVSKNLHRPRMPEGVVVTVAAAQRWAAVWRSLRVWVLALLVVQGLLVVRADAKEQELDHKAITLAVETALLNDGGVRAHLIDVNTRDGVVTLSGWVDNLLAKERAGQIAESVKGVGPFH